MLRFRTMKGVVSLLLTGLLVLSFADVATAAEEELPGSIKSYVQRINNMLDQADKAMEADHLTTAERKVKEADKAIEEMTRRYSGKFSEDHPDYVAMIDHHKATSEKLGLAAGAAAASAEDAENAKAENEALCQAWVDKLGAFVDRRSEKYLRIGSDLNGASEAEQAQCRAAFAEAKTLMAEYEKVTFPEGKTMALKNIESSLTSTMKYYQQDEDRAGQEAASAPWIARLRPYVDFFPGNDNVLITSATVDPEQIKAQQAIYKQAKAAYDDYLKAEFPGGKSWQLQQLETKLARELEAFPGTMAESMAMISGDIGKRMDGVLGFLNRDNAWQSDMSKKPVTIMQRDLKPLREELKRMADTGSAGQARAFSIQS